MLQPFLGNTAKIIRYIALWMVYAILQIYAVYSLVAISFWIIVLDGFVHAVLYGVLGILLWSVIRYGNYSILNNYQRLINFIALGVLVVLLWLGIGYGVIYLIYGDLYSNALFQLLPVRGLIGVLIYLLIIQQFTYSNNEIKTEDEHEEILSLPEETKPEKEAGVEIIERIAVKSGSKIHVVLVPEIVYLQADGDYVQIITSTGKYLKEQTMKYFEGHLPDNQFVRVHRSAIVNVEMISRIELYEKQSQILTLKNGHQLKTSTAGYKALRGVLNL